VHPNSITVSILQQAILNHWSKIGRVGASPPPNKRKLKVYIYLAKFTLSVTSIAADIKLTAIAKIRSV
jgi:hypothetical protein